ncbi:Six-hairpin glycosidase [Sodiomyces alkalinus F11]|uniref:Six-hairpin glycosidase n=1 Tax=Sodiomyces alkalinus (strain CBS 110278 / VKM F-3762 / F11) TaxID=1314773 RepID=A0A3N2PKD2_SODAK|nr:Six-hairpin glycosidase [Sodiomyces alkalinus F11]ROT34973.1 Six-hairpin glycosidase [Sodiomyces alkalinus F11]
MPGRLVLTLLLLQAKCLTTFLTSRHVLASAASTARTQYCPVFHPTAEVPTNCEPNQPWAFVELQVLPPTQRSTNGSEVDLEGLKYAFEALTVMQTEFFRADRATWPEAIDWTAAVLGTTLAGTLTSLSRAFAVLDLVRKNEAEFQGNLVDLLFTQLVSSYHGQDDFAIRHQAYDDMLWVVLGWLDAMKFVRSHSDLHYPPRDPQNIVHLDLAEALRSSPWHGHFWAPSFAHRSRLFWESASHGWDETLCNGGMIWHPWLRPYKNAVTNQLWIAASISMYLWFPGDNNTSPWVDGRFSPASSTRDPKYLAAAIQGYKWLADVNMTNSAGLFVDGYHIDRFKEGNTRCDIRSEMVFTYNQGIILTGQRGLWTATGSASYLEDGHRLIQSVIKASGWDLKTARPLDDLSKLRPGHLPPWRGLGRGGIVEERCDASGTCSQDGQTFKGIFFHHLTAFCEAIEPPGFDTDSDITVDQSAYRQIRTAHETACFAYSSWVQHNAKAALMTRDEKGRFGMWWGAHLFGNASPTMKTDGVPRGRPHAADYRNYGIPHDPLWHDGNPDEIWRPNGKAQKTTEPGLVITGTEEAGQQQVLLGSRNDEHGRPVPDLPGSHQQGASPHWDPNTRGRGRTAETQNGGAALMRAWWELYAGSRHLHPQKTR